MTHENFRVINLFQLLNVVVLKVVQNSLLLKNKVSDFKDKKKTFKLNIFSIFILSGKAFTNYLFLNNKHD